MTNKKLDKVKAYVKKKMQGSKDPQHEWIHTKRVRKNCQEIVRSLNLESRVDCNLLGAVCYLHDINRVNYPPGIINYFFETRNSKKVLPNVLAKLNIEGPEKQIIENAIYSSSFSFPFRKLNKGKDLYTQILQDADTIDFFNNDRIKSFKKVKGRFLFFKLLSPFSDWAVNYGKKNLSKFLNFPQLASNYYVQES